MRTSLKEEPTELERVLWLHGQFRRCLEPIGVTPLQAGILLHLHRHTDTNMTKTAAAFCIRLPTLTEVIDDLARKRWVMRRRSTIDTRVVQLRLSSRGNALAVKIAHGVGQVATMPTSPG
jgi:DNA-binding MarR family transcriptional regulator